MPNNTDREQVRIEQQIRKDHELKYVGSKRHQAGHTLFSVNTKTGEIKKAIVKKCDTCLFPTGEPLWNPKVIVEPNCIYIEALNIENLKKKLKKQRL